MKRPADADLLIYARDAFREMWPGERFETEVFGGGRGVQAWSLDQSKCVTLGWAEDAGVAVVRFREGRADLRQRRAHSEAESFGVAVRRAAEKFAKAEWEDGRGGAGGER